MRNQKENFAINNNVFVSTDKYTQGPAKSVEKLGKREKETPSPKLLPEKSMTYFEDTD